MIQSTLEIIIDCHRCEAQVETSEMLDQARRPDVDLFEERAVREAEADGWKIDTEAESFLCSDCAKEAS